MGPMSKVLAYASTVGEGRTVLNVLVNLFGRDDRFVELPAE